jgi:hypothetical protein
MTQAMNLILQNKSVECWRQAEKIETDDSYDLLEPSAMFDEAERSLIVVL